MSAERKKLILAIAVIFAANIFIIALVQYASADLYKRGSSGDTVREIQTRLKNWGYYSGAVDGVYGSGTEEAVRLFQRKNGLSVDGQVGDQTLAALGISPSSSGGSCMPLCIQNSTSPVLPPTRKTYRESRAGSSAGNPVMWVFMQRKQAAIRALARFPRRPSQRRSVVISGSSRS